MKRNYVWKSSRKLDCCWVLTIYILHIWNVLRVITNFFFYLKFRFLNFCESFIPDFESLCYILHLNELEDDVSEEKDLENDSSVEICDVTTASSDNKLNVKDNVAKMLGNRFC